MNNYKLIVEKRGKKDFFKLYQLSNDPDESSDLSVEKHKIAMKLFQIISNLRRKNEVRQKQNLKRLDKDIDLERIMKQKTEILKSLGYIE